MSKKLIKEATILNGGWLVSLKSEVTGNTQYHKRTLEAAHAGDAGEERSKWQTEKVVWDPDEQKEAEKVRDKARSLVTSVCSYTDHGLLCPEDREEELYAALELGQQMARDFNATAVFAHVSVRYVCGWIARDDEQTVRSIANNTLELIEQMRAAIDELDVKRCRKVCDKAVKMSNMFAGAARANIQTVVDVYRAECTRLVKAGEAAAVEFDAFQLEQLEAARTTFIDLEETGVMVEVADEDARAIDFEPTAVTIQEAS